MTSLLLGWSRAESKFELIKRRLQARRAKYSIVNTEVNKILCLSLTKQNNLEKVSTVIFSLYNILYLK